jgi:hypothetical protein
VRDRALRPGRHDRGGGARWPVRWWVVLVLLAVVLVTQYGHGLRAAFVNDDYIFLDKTRAASFTSLWAPRDLLFHYYRPWSRELHFAVLQRLFGPRETPFHVVSFVLWLVVMGLWYTTARRFSGVPAAAVAVACTASSSGWTVPILWASGAQELWMLLFGLLVLQALGRGATGWATAALLGALLSKETAAVLPAVALLQLRLLERVGWGTVLRRTAPLWAVTAVWSIWHPLLGGRLWHPIHEPSLPGVHPAAASIATRTLLSLFDLTPWPRPESGFGPALRLALPAVAALVGLCAWGLRNRRPHADAERTEGRPSAKAVAAFGGCWALLGWLPLGLPSIAWRSHYALLGLLGAWLAIAVWLVRRPALALAMTVTLALLRAAVADTPTRDWSSEWYRRRAGAFMEHLRADLLRKLPSPPSHSRMFFVLVPSDVGFLAGDAPALRVWYRDPTLRGGFYTDYRPRAAGDPEGPDYFFRYDSTTGWVPVVRGPEDAAATRRANPRWSRDHGMLARTLAAADDWLGAAAEYVKLAAAESLAVDWAFDAGVCYETLGDSAAAAAWYARAAARPGADDDVRARARRLARHLRAPESAATFR